MKSLFKILLLSMTMLITAVNDTNAQSPYKPKALFSRDSSVHQFDGSRWMNLVQVSLDSTTTTDANYHTIKTVNIATNEIGTLTVGVIGINDSLTVATTGEQIVRYAKVDGTLTLGTPAATLTTTTDSGLSGALWDISTSGNQIIVRVKGKNTYTVRWMADIRRRKFIKRS